MYSVTAYSRCLVSSLPLPRQNLHQSIREIVCELRICATILDIREGMRKGSSCRPGHGKDEMQRNGESLRAVDVGKARRVCNDGVCKEGDAGVWIWFNA